MSNQRNGSWIECKLPQSLNQPRTNAYIRFGERKIRELRGLVSRPFERAVQQQQTRGRPAQTVREQHSHAETFRLERVINATIGRKHRCGRDQRFLQAVGSDFTKYGL